VTTEATETAPWAWWAGDGETFHYGPHATREDAIDDAMNNECGFDDEENVCRFEVIEAYQSDLQLAKFMPSQFDRLVERWDEHLSEDYGGEGCDDSLLGGITQAQWDELKATLTQAVASWQAQNKIVVKSWRFTNTRNNQDIAMSVAEWEATQCPATEDQRGSNGGS